METKCLILGEQQYSVWDAASQSTKRIHTLKIGVANGPLGTPGYACACDVAYDDYAYET